MNELKRICIFCGASFGALDAYADAARTLGKTLAARKIGIVFGGGRVGLMGIVADAALSAGGEVIGVIPRALATKELAHGGLKELRVVDSMHERKAQMAELADAFIALPGGYGTLEEFFEVLTWAHLGFHRKPVAVLNVAGFFDPLLALVDHAMAEKFISPLHRSLLISSSDIDDLLEKLATYKAPEVVRWIDRGTS